MAINVASNVASNEALNVALNVATNVRTFELALDAGMTHGNVLFTFRKLCLLQLYMSFVTIVLIDCQHSMC